MPGGPRQPERPTRPCTHNNRHPHGTPSRYSIDGCRCDPCTESKVRYDNHRRKQIAYGRWNPGYVTPHRALAHAMALRNSGMGYRRIAELAGIRPCTVQRLLRGIGTKITSQTETAILSVPLSPAAGTSIDSTGTRRRVEALAAIGWSLIRIGSEAGISNPTIQDILAGVVITRTTAQKVKAAYDRLWNTHPPTGNRWELGARNRTVNWAAKKGFVPPLAWDDETIDDPNATPMGVERKKKRVNKGGEHVVEDVEFLYETGSSPIETAQRIGIRRDSLWLALRRHGRPDLAAWVSGSVEAPHLYEAADKRKEAA